MNYSDKTIKEIAELIDCGHLCFLEKANGKIEYYPKEIDLFLDEENPWQDVIDKIENNQSEYVRIEKMNSKQSFLVMENFTEKLESESLRKKLLNALNRSKAFRNFKYLIEISDYRQNWFDFKLEQNIRWIKEQISDQEK